MYTGIVSHALTPSELVHSEALLTLKFKFDQTLLDGLKVGASVAVDGVCLTVREIADNVVAFDAMQETLDRTTLGSLTLDKTCNIERSAKFGDEVGGHQLSGHIDGKARIADVKTSPNSHILHFSVSKKLIPYLFEKGYVGIHGCSLTIAGLDLNAATFWVSLIPETLRITNLGDLKVGDEVNLEIDRTTQVIVDTISRCFERFLESPKPSVLS